MSTWPSKRFSISAVRQRRVCVCVWMFIKSTTTTFRTFPNRNFDCFFRLQFSYTFEKLVRNCNQHIYNFIHENVFNKKKTNRCPLSTLSMGIIMVRYLCSLDRYQFDTQKLSNGEISIKKILWCNTHWSFIYDIKNTNNNSSFRSEIKAFNLISSESLFKTINQLWFHLPVPLLCNHNANESRQHNEWQEKYFYLSSIWCDVFFLLYYYYYWCCCFCGCLNISI